MTNVPELFGSMVFNQQTMKERLPKETFKALKRTLDNGEPLQIDVANVVAHAMKEWAIEKGATHYSHWFQPLTGVTAAAVGTDSLSFTFYPEIEYSSPSILGISGILSYLALILLPLIIETEVRLKWKYLRSAV